MKVIITETKEEDDILPAVYRSNKDNILVLFYGPLQGSEIADGKLKPLCSSWIGCTNRNVWTRLSKGTKLELIQD